MERLSSRMTVFAKFVTPTFWFLMLVLSVLLSVARMWISEVDLLDAVATLFLVALPMGLFTALFWLNSQLKVVWLKGDDIIVSNYWCQCTISLRDVDRVSGLFLPGYICLTLRRPSLFGERIWLLGQTPLIPGLTRNRTLDQLRGQIERLRE